MHTNRFIDFSEVTRLTSLKRTALYSLIKQGEIKPIKLGQKTVFLESHIQAWIADRITSSEVIK